MLASSTVVAMRARAFIFKRINVFSSKVNLSFDDANATSDSIRADEDIGEDNIIRCCRGRCKSGNRCWQLHADNLHRFSATELIAIHQASESVRRLATCTGD